MRPPPTERMMRTAILIGVTVAGLGVMPSFAHGPTPDLSDKTRIQAGKERFASSCAAYCHGSEGSGGRAPAFRDRDDLDPLYAFKTIHDGRQGPAGAMPAWSASFSDEEIWDLVAYVTALGAEKP